MKQNKLFAQSTLEYTVFIIIVVAALLTTLVFLKNKFQANWQESADSLGEGRQFETGVTEVTR